MSYLEADLAEALGDGLEGMKFPHEMDARCQICDKIFGAHMGGDPNWWCPPYPGDKMSARYFVLARECVYPRLPTAEETYDMLTSQ